MKAVDPVGRPDVIVIGASAGGVEALTRLVRELPGTFPVPVLVVLRRAARSMPRTAAQSASVSRSSTPRATGACKKASSSPKTISRRPMRSSSRRPKSWRRPTRSSSPRTKSWRRPTVRGAIVLMEPR
jgi:hypothetical protein